MEILWWSYGMMHMGLCECFLFKFGQIIFFSSWMIWFTFKKLSGYSVPQTRCSSQVHFNICGITRAASVQLLLHLDGLCSAVSFWLAQSGLLPVCKMKVGKRKMWQQQKPTIPEVTHLTSIPQIYNPVPEMGSKSFQMHWNFLHLIKINAFLTVKYK